MINKDKYMPNIYYIGFMRFILNTYTQLLLISTRNNYNKRDAVTTGRL